MPERLLALLLSGGTEKLFRHFKDIDLTKDVFNEYYQSEHGDRDKLKQDFTPDSVAGIVSALAGDAESVADICAGTGTLTIKNWCENPNRFHYLEEYSSRAIPVLLFNLVLRNINAEVVHCDSLTREVFATYRVENRKVARTNTRVDQKYKAVIMNPPYSMKWSGQNDERFQDYGVAPKSKADYAFVLHGLQMLEDDGKLIAILPHGVLFRGGEEAKIRKNLVQNNLIEAIIGLPPDLFLNTGIPVLIMVLNKKKQDNNTLFVDASKEFTKSRPNILEPEHVDKILTAVKNRWEISKFSALINFEEMERNDFNLNIPRYVDTTEPEVYEDPLVLLKELRETNQEIYETESELFGMIEQLAGTSPEKQRELDKCRKAIEVIKDERSIPDGYSDSGEGEEREGLFSREYSDRFISNQG